MNYLIEIAFFAKCAQFIEDTLIIENALLYSFWISFVVIGFVYVIKYFFSVTPELANKTFAAIVDFPNELFIVLIPIIVAGSIQHNAESLGFILVLIAVFLSCITLFIRMCCINLLNKDKPGWKSVGLSILLYFIAFGFGLVVYSLIQTSWK